MGEMTRREFIHKSCIITALTCSSGLAAKEEMPQSLGCLSSKQPSIPSDWLRDPETWHGGRDRLTEFKRLTAKFLER